MDYCGQYFRCVLFAFKQDHCLVRSRVILSVFTCSMSSFQFNSKRPKRKATSASIKPKRKKMKSALDSDDDDEDVDSGKNYLFMV